MQSIQDRLMADVVALTANGGRNVGTAGHDLARDYIATRLTEIGVTPYSGDSFLHPYESQGSDFVNIIGTIPGSNPAKEPLLLGAHFDTCGDIPGADDNAAAVAILLAVAESLQKTVRDRSVVLAFFDAEEPPYFLSSSMGSIRFYEDQRTGPVHAAIILDLVGHDVPVDGLEDLLFITGAESDPRLEMAVRSSEPESGLRTVPTLNSYVGDLSDHHIFRENERPYLLLTCGHWEHYHMPTDTPEKLSMSKMEAVANYVVTLTKFLSPSSLNGPSSGDGPTLGDETLDMEIFFLEKNIMPTLRNLGISLPLNSRTDIDRLVTLLISQFGL
jgi:hypothetical protein